MSRSCTSDKFAVEKEIENLLVKIHATFIAIPEFLNVFLSCMKGDCFESYVFVI